MKFLETLLKKKDLKSFSQGTMWIQLLKNTCKKLKRDLDVWKLFKPTNLVIDIQLIIVQRKIV